MTNATLKTTVNTFINIVYTLLQHFVCFTATIEEAHIPYQVELLQIR